MVRRLNRSRVSHGFAALARDDKPGIYRMTQNTPTTIAPMNRNTKPRVRMCNSRTMDALHA